MQLKNVYNVLDYSKDIIVSCYDEDDITAKKEWIKLKAVPSYMAQMPNKLDSYIVGRSIEIPKKLWLAEVRQITEDYGKILIAVTAKTDAD